MGIECSYYSLEVSQAYYLSIFIKFFRWSETSPFRGLFEFDNDALASLSFLVTSSFGEEQSTDLYPSAGVTRRMRSDVD